MKNKDSWARFLKVWIINRRSSIPFPFPFKRLPRRLPRQLHRLERQGRMTILTYLVILDKRVNAGRNTMSSSDYMVWGNQGASTTLILTRLAHDSSLPRPRPWG